MASAVAAWNAGEWWKQTFSRMSTVTPKKALASASGTPACIARVMAVWRRVCGVAPSIPAA